MHFTTVAAAALVAITPVIATGSAHVYNKCDFNVTLWSVTADTKELIPNLILPGANYSEEYQVPSIGGVSLKLSGTDTCAGPITQFEYTLAGNIWYDISNVDCTGPACPFQPYGMYMHSGENCPTRSCPAGEPYCKGAYTAPTDDWNSLACQGDADISLYLCTSEPPTEETIPPAEEYGVPARRRFLRHRHSHPHFRG